MSARSQSRNAGRQAQDYPPGSYKEVQMNVLTPNAHITYIDQDQSYA